VIKRFYEKQSTLRANGTPISVFKTPGGRNGAEINATLVFSGSITIGLTYHKEGCDKIE
tara:strand:+ start:454 stop:630 length:177 start_codon:yes stop_codon:yes gene_type:complete